jgi:thiosulfate dehydrogenase [quinone] large subunit
MSTIQHHPETVPADVRVQDEVVTSSGARKALAVLRIGFGLTFLWAFFDKLLALGFATGTNPETGAVDRFGDAAWINGASPTEGFLTFGVNPDSPFAGLFNNLAGYAIVDWLFMLGLLSIGVALTLGIGMRFAGVAGGLLYLMMYAAVMVPENNPVFDDHLLGAISVVVLALTLAGDTWGLGKVWARMPFVHGNGFLR